MIGFDVRKKSWVIAVVIMTGPSCAWAFTGATTTPAGAAFSASCAGLGFSGGGQVGDAFNDGVSSVTPSVNCQTSTSAVGGTATSSAVNIGADSGGAFSNSASGTAAPKVILLNAVNNGVQASQFPGGQTNAGWNEMINLSLPGHSGSAVWVVPITVKGLLTATGSGALALLGVGAYLNNTTIEPTDPQRALANTLFFANNITHNGTVVSSWDSELVEWEATNYGPGDPLTLPSLTADQTINFYIPFTWGTSFELGIFAEAHAGEISSGGAFTPNTAIVDPPSVAWGGPGYVLDGGVGDPITGFSISSLSGTDYTTPFSESVPPTVPEPRPLTLLGLGFAALSLARRRSRSLGSARAA